MTAIILTLLLVILVAALLSYPLLRGSHKDFQFFVSGKNRASELILRRRIILENLRDIRTERDLGKMTLQDFEKLALPLAESLEHTDGLIREASARTIKTEELRPNRLGLYCPVCGKLNPYEKGNKKQGAKDHDTKDQDTKEPDKKNPDFCVQCGHEFG